MNKKFYIFLTVAVLSASAAQAQFSVGARAGFNLSNVYGADTGDSKWKPGFQIGVVGDYALSDAFSLQPGILFSTLGWKVDHSSSETIMGETVNIAAKTTTNLNYIQIPVNAQYKLDLGSMKLLLQAGPYFGFGLGGKLKGETIFDGKKENIDEKIKMGNDEVFKVFDIGLGAGAGLQFGSVQIGLAYQLGFVNLNNMSDIVDTKMYNHGLSLSVTYLFGK